MTMTSEAKAALSTTIRALRARLLSDLHAAVDSGYRMALRARDAGLSEEALARRLRLERWLAEQARAQGAEDGKGSKKRRSAEEFQVWGRREGSPEERSSKKNDVLQSAVIR